MSSQPSHCGAAAAVWPAPGVAVADPVAMPTAIAVQTNPDNPVRNIEPSRPAGFMAAIVARCAHPAAGRYGSDTEV